MESALQRIPAALRWRVFRLKAGLKTLKNTRKLKNRCIYLCLRQAECLSADYFVSFLKGATVKFCLVTGGL
jgi:hypothetical protein